LAFGDRHRVHREFRTLAGRSAAGQCRRQDAGVCARLKGRPQMNQPEVPRPTDPVDMTAVELVSAYAAGALSPVEATEAVLAAITARDPDINAYCLVDPDRALVQAKDSEARWQSGHVRGLLDGVPISIKDI